MITLTQDCQGFVATEGEYTLQQDIFLDQVPAHPVIPTYVSSVSVKYKDYQNSAGNGTHNGGAGSDIHGMMAALTLERLDDHLKDLKVTEGKDAADDESSGHLAGNFHGTLVDLPLYNDDTPKGAGAGGSGGGMMSPGPPQVMTPGPPPLKDSTPIKEINHSQGTKSLGRAATFPMLHDISESSQGISSYATIGPSLAASVGLTSLFSGKRKKNNIAKTNSTFVAKITTNENLSKILANRVNEDVYVFWNTGKTFTWSELGQKPNEPLSHISFSKASPTSHDVNILTRSCDHLDVIIGFSTGDIIWFNPLSNKYCRLNKQAIIKDSAVTMIRWLPGSESQFMASFQDGTIVVMDKDRDDNTFSVSIPPHENSFHPTKPKNGRHNPVSHWHIGRKPVTAFAFSPDLQHTAVVAMDGGLRIIDFRNERLIDTFQSYFGALNCVCWSPDGRYILTGGQDDLVTIWSFKDMKIVARCQGHQSYVTGVAFDPWRCDERNYRFGSVGEDAKLLLWDFSVGALHKPKAATLQRSGSAAGRGLKSGHRKKNSLSSLRGHGGNSLFSGHHHHHTKSPLSQETVLTSESQSSSTEPSTAAVPPTSSTSSQDAPALGNSQKCGESISTVTNEPSEGGEQAAQPKDPISSLNTRDVGSGIKQGFKKQTLQQSRGLPALHLYPSQPSTDLSGSTAENSKGSEQQQQGHALSSIFQSNRGQHPQQPQQSQEVNSTQEPLARPPEPRSRVAMLQPSLAVAIHQEPLASITFREDSIMTSDRRGHIKIWKRPSSSSSSDTPASGTTTSGTSL
ncbi:hypothetical protein BGX34_000170 [Mortierella sp. NVP85]|nr:hypothetical protein BGX34_000170 [Mortierella sp. NVP85]